MLVLIPSSCWCPTSSWSTVGWVFEQNFLLGLIHCIAPSNNAPTSLPVDSTWAAGRNSSPREAFLTPPCVLRCQLCSFSRIWRHACHHCASTRNSQTFIWGYRKPEPLKGRHIFVFMKVCNEYFMEKGLIKHHAISCFPPAITSH